MSGSYAGYQQLVAGLRVAVDAKSARCCKCQLLRGHGERRVSGSLSRQFVLAQRSERISDAER